MQIKTFSGSDPQIVLAQVKADMGDDAVILSSKEVRAADGQRWHEVTAGVEHPGGQSMPPEWTEWHKEWIKMKEHLYALMQPSIQWERLSPRHRLALEYLQREGVADPVIIELYQKMLNGASVLEALGDLVPARPWGLEKWQERVHILTGPYGSGKTTVALRLGMLLRQESAAIKIAYVNADCERGNGRLILRHWAELSGFTYTEATDAETMRIALQNLSEVDKILIDLPGTGGNFAHLSEHLACLGIQNLGAPIHLALPPHYNDAQNRAFLNRYQSSLLSSVIWTKLDEAAGCGPLINVAANSGLPVSALSYGPGMRRTLAPAKEIFLWRLIFKRQLPGQDEGNGENVANTNESEKKISGANA